jgi:hypothetical protein
MMLDMVRAVPAINIFSSPNLCPSCPAIRRNAAKVMLIHYQDPIDAFSCESKSLLDIRERKEYRRELEEIQEVDHCSCQQNAV